MALFISGMKCNLCGCTMNDKDNLIMVPACISNEIDPLYIFNDSTFHKKCFEEHPLSDKMIELLHKLNSVIFHKNRICTICNKGIDNPDNYIAFGCLSSLDNELSQFNFRQYHKNCFISSDDAEKIKSLTNQMRDKRLWRGEIGY